MDWTVKNETKLLKIKINIKNSTSPLLSLKSWTLLFTYSQMSRKRPPPFHFDELMFYCKIKITPSWQHFPLSWTSISAAFLGTIHLPSAWCIYCLLWCVYSLTAVSCVLASTITTSNCPAAAFAVTPNLSPTAKHQLHTYISLTLIFFFFFPTCHCCRSFSYLIVLSTQNACSHTPLLMFLAVCPAGSAQPSVCVSSCPLVITLSFSVSTDCQ